MLPQELGCGSGMTCWRRLRDWQQAGIWQLIHFSLLDWLARCGRLIGRGLSWTAVRSVQFLGASDRTEPY
jgi:transposase